MIFGFCTMETNNDLDENNFKSMGGMDALLELMEKVKSWRLTSDKSRNFAVTPIYSWNISRNEQRSESGPGGRLAGGWPSRSELGQQKSRRTHGVLSSKSSPFLSRQLLKRKCSLLRCYLLIYNELGGWPHDSNRAHHRPCK